MNYDFPDFADCEDHFEEDSFIDVKHEPFYFSKTGVYEAIQHSEWSDDEDELDNSFEQGANEHVEAVQEAFGEYLDAVIGCREDINLNQSD